MEKRAITRDISVSNRKIGGYALVFSSESNDLGGFYEVIAPDALDGVLAISDVKAYYNHDQSRGILARSKYGEGSLTLTVDETGLYYEFEAPNTSLGDEVLEAIQRGDVTGSSFAFTVENDRWEHRTDGMMQRTILKFGQIFDVSPVIDPAYPETSVALRNYKINQINNMSKREEGELTVEEKIAQLEAMKENETDEAVLAEIEKQIAELEATREEPDPEEKPENTPDETEEEQKDCDPEEDLEKPEDEEQERDAKFARIRAIVGEPADSKLENQDKIDELKKQLEEEEDPEVQAEIQKQIDALEERKTRKNKKTTRNMSKFSLLKAIRDVAEHRNLDDAAKAVVEAGVKEMRKAGLDASGQIIIPIEHRAADPGAIVAGQATYGQEVVAEDKLNIVGPLRDKMVLSEAGATYMTGLVGDVNIPFYSGSNAAWKGELATADDGKGAFSEITLSPKRLTTKIVLSKQFLLQDSVGAEALIKKDIVDAIADKLEKTILGAAAGSATQPAGIFNGVTADTAAVSYGTLVNIEKEVEEANVAGAPVYIVNPAMKAVLRQTSVGGTKSDLRMIFENNEINGVKTLVTNNASGIAYGDFSEMLIGSWGAVSLTVDPYTRAADDAVVLVVNAYFDCKMRRANAVKAYLPKAD